MPDDSPLSVFTPKNYKEINESMSCQQTFHLHEAINLQTHVERHLTHSRITSTDTARTTVTLVDLSRPTTTANIEICKNDCRACRY
ncbi:hypothetical protein BGW80DRAFT_1307594 [Lactifluus volemus]|nr:hypothetical protein BGW80DRAFT_1307594 [Lactifluus volemus]